jgi:cysteine desulfurase
MRVICIHTPTQIVFTSCGTESNNWALTGSVQLYNSSNSSSSGSSKDPIDVSPRIICSSIEHPAVSECAKQLQTEGKADVSLVEVTSEGVVLASAVGKALQAGGAALVTVMHSNNEVSLW